MPDPRFRKPFPPPHPNSLRLTSQQSGQREQGFSAQARKELECCGMLWSVVGLSTKRAHQHKPKSAKPGYPSDYPGWFTP